MTDIDGSKLARVLPSGTVTFLFTDVEGSTRLWAADKGAMSASLLVHDAILRAAIESHGGYVFTTAGDSFAAAFGRASDAVTAADESQRALTNAVWPGPVLKVRMGLHLGEAEERGGDYFGPVVNTAARVEAAGHGGQVLITEGVRSAAGVVDVTDLGTRQLRDVTEAVRLFQLGPGVFAPLRVVDPALSNLPVRPTRLIGREADIAVVRQRLTTSRVVTVTAVGCSGKTRVTLAVGEAELAHRSAGVWFVDLTAVMNENDVPAAIAAALGLTLTTGDPTAQVITYLRDKPALVIVDNCEHLIDACAAFVEAFLATNGPAVILATSREALAVDGEQVVVLSPLPSDTADSPAVRLFMDRATAADPRFELTGTDAATVATICARLDGMPLAIELAAARVTVMNPTELLAGLDNRFQLLSGGRRRQRARTLEATLDWSYDLLEPADQHVFRALGVFVDGFDIAAVAAVTNTSRTDALEAIEALVAKSLVDRADHHQTVRFRLLETVKAYAEDRLVDTSEAAGVRDRHFDYFHRAATIHGRIIFADLNLALRLRADHSNIAAAFEWAVTTGRHTEAAGLLLGAMGVLQLDQAWLEALPLLERSITACAPIDTDLTERLKTVRADLMVHVFDPGSGAAFIELTSSPVASVRAIGLVMVAATEAMYGRTTPHTIAEAQRLLDELEPEDSGHVVLFPQGLLLLTRAVVAAQTGNYTSCLAHSQEVLTLNRDFKDLSTFDRGASLVALCHILLGNPAAGIRTINEIEPYGLPGGRGDDIRAIAALAVGDLDTATREVRHFAERAASGCFVGEATNGVILMAGLCLGEGDTQQARTLLARTAIGRNPMGNIYGDHLARQLDVLDERLARMRKTDGQSPEQRSESINGALHALKTEMTRRGWH